MGCYFREKSESLRSWACLTIRSFFSVEIARIVEKENLLERSMGTFIFIHDNFIYCGLVHAIRHLVELKKKRKED